MFIRVSMYKSVYKCIFIKNALILWSICVESMLFSPSFDFLHVHMHPDECWFHLHVAFSLTYCISLACIFYTCYIADSSVDPIFLTKTFVTLHSLLALPLSTPPTIRFSRGHTYFLKTDAPPTNTSTFQCPVHCQALACA